MSETMTEISPAFHSLLYFHAYTNQQIIDAFFRAANNLASNEANAGDYQGLLARAGLDVDQLAANREGVYSGQSPSDLLSLSTNERQLIYQSLLRQLQRDGKAGRVTAPAGLNLRSGPGADHDLLTSLPLNTDITVLGAEGDWLLVSAGEQTGWLLAAYVDRNPTATPISNNGATPNAYTGPLEPPTQLQPPSDDLNAAAAAATWNRYGGLIEAESTRLNFDPAVAVAILGVESSGDAFENNRMVIRFENHIFLAYWGKDHRDLFDLHFTGSSDSRQHRFRADPNGDWLLCHTNQDREWQTFNFARTLNETAAMYAISMGAAQVMGFNYASIGYATVQAMFAAFQNDVRNQLAALFRFIEVNHLQDAVRKPDFVAFARTYNGQGQETVYALRMQNFYDGYHKLLVSRHAIARPRLPQPGTPTLLDNDPELAAAWRAYVVANFTNMQTLFQRLLNGFLRPYWTTVWMYRILFALGVCSFILAAALAIFTGRTLFVLTFGGISALTLLGYFFNRPTQALEQNLQYLTWLGIVYNSYWTQLTLLNDEQSVQTDISALTDEAIEQLKALVAEHAKRRQP